MPILSPTLQSQTAAQVTKLGWSNTVKTLLGNSRRIRCFRDSNPSAPNPASTGVEFLNIASTGELGTTAGNITNFGVLSGFTVRQAADLSSGSSVLVLEGNGHSITYTLGLTGSGKEFTLPVSPSSNPNIGFAFSANSGTKAPILLDSGTGPLSPSLTGAAPNKVDIQDWSSGAAVLVGTLTFDTRLPNWVFDDPEVSSNMGDIRVYRSSQSVTFGDMQLGALMFAMTGQANSVSSDPVYQVLVGLRPTIQNWPNYPSLEGYIYGTSDTFAKAFKALIKDTTNQPLFLMEMRDGPINGPQLKFGKDKANFPVRPHLNCAQMLPWQSSKPKMNTNVSKWCPGFDETIFRPTVARKHYSSNQVVPMIGNLVAINSLGQFYAQPKWPMAGNAAAQAGDTNADPYLFPSNVSAPYPGGATGTNGVWRATGYGYEYGGVGPIDTTTGPGGARVDRAAMPHVLAVLVTKPDYRRPKGNETIQELADNWNLSYFNLSVHYITDAATMSSLPLKECAEGGWLHCKTYYAALDSYLPAGKSRSVPQFAIAAGNSVPFLDKNNNRPWNDQALDYLHNYSCPVWTALLFNSPMHAYSATHRLISSFLCQIPGTVSTVSDGGESSQGIVMQRRGAWRIFQLVMAWKIRSSHEYGISGQIIIDRFERELNAIYDVYKTSIIDNSSHPYFKSLRTVGLSLAYNGKWEHNSTSSGTQHFYIAHALQLMKQFGLFEIMWNKSDRCRDAIKFIFRCLDLGSVDFILDTNGRTETPNPVYGDAVNNAQVVDSWADWAARNPATGIEDWVADSTGAFRRNEVGEFNEQDITQHLRYQWVCVHQEYFPEIPCERVNGLALARAKYEGYYARVTTLATTAPLTRINDWTWLWAGLARIKPVAQ